MRQLVGVTRAERRTAGFRLGVTDGRRVEQHRGIELSLDMFMTDLLDDLHQVLGR